MGIWEGLQLKTDFHFPITPAVFSLQHPHSKVQDEGVKSVGPSGKLRNLFRFTFTPFHSSLNLAFVVGKKKNWRMFEDMGSSVFQDFCGLPQISLQNRK